MDEATIATQEAPGHDQNDTNPTPEDSSTDRIARLILEDFVVTLLLSRGRALKGAELSAAADGFSLTRAGLRDGLEQSQLLVAQDRDWELRLRPYAKSLNREERGRLPLENTLRSLLEEFKKPLPLPVIVREASPLRGAYPDELRDATHNILRSSHWALEIREKTYHTTVSLFDSNPSTEEQVIRVNKLNDDLDFRELQNSNRFANIKGSLRERAIAVLKAADRPITQKLLGFLVWRSDPTAFNSRELARTLGDRDTFNILLHDYVTLQEQMPQWRGTLGRWMQSLGGAAAEALDVGALLRQRLAPSDIRAPREEEIEEVRNFARGADGHPFSLATILTDVLEMEADDESFVPRLQGLNDALRRNPEFLSAGIGRFLLREAVPTYVGATPEELRPIHLSIRHTETNEPLDMEMSDDGLEGDAADFIHSPQWEDVNEEVEVKLPRKTASDEVTETRYVILNHHHRAGTIKLRRMDEDFFSLEGALARINVRASDADGNTELGAWASRESGLIYGLGDWFIPRTPESGGVLAFTRDPGSSRIQMKLEAPDKLTLIESARAAELATHRESAAYLSLYDLLQTIMSHHPSGAELPTLWAEVNVVRRTSKRLLCSVLCAYHCYYFKQRGPKQILWRFDAGRIDQGFKRNKRKYVRR